MKGNPVTALGGTDTPAPAPEVGAFGGGRPIASRQAARMV
jgi:hypothetical protein